MTNVVFVAPYALAETARFVAAVTAVPGARVGLVSTDPIESFPDAVRGAIAGHWRTPDCLDPGALSEAVAALADHLGSVDRLVAILETAQVSVAEVRQRLGIAGLTVAVAENFRDKARMKAAFEAAGVPCARSARAASAAEAVAFVERVGYPVVVKPLAGAGARATFRLDEPGQLGVWLGDSPPTEAAPVIIEEFVQGDEHSFDSVVVDGELVWYSVSRYLPTPLDVLSHPWIQWAVVLPLDLAPYEDVRALGHHAVTALGLRTGLSHLEWFRRADRSVAVSEVAARPPGAGFMALLSFAHDVDLHASWAGLAVDERFDPPPRRFAVGAAYLRAQGKGRAIVAAHGLDQVSPATRELVVEVRLPSYGAPPTGTYEGDGHVIVRSQDTAAVERAIGEVISTIRLELA